MATISTPLDEEFLRQLSIDLEQEKISIRKAINLVIEQIKPILPLLCTYKWGGRTIYRRFFSGLLFGKSYDVPGTYLLEIHRGTTALTVEGEMVNGFIEYSGSVRYRKEAWCLDSPEGATNILKNLITAINQKISSINSDYESRKKAEKYCRQELVNFLAGKK